MWRRNTTLTLLTLSLTAILVFLLLLQIRMLQLVEAGSVSASVGVTPLPHIRWVSCLLYCLQQPTSQLFLFVLAGDALKHTAVEGPLALCFFNSVPQQQHQRNCHCHNCHFCNQPTTTGMTCQRLWAPAPQACALALYLLSCTPYWLVGPAVTTASAA